jgi:PEP-CTERM motif
MRHTVQSVIAACLLASASPVAAQIINGGFEDGAFGDGSVREVSRGDTALSGWTVIENPIAWYTKGYEPNPLNPIGVGPHSGNLAVSLCDGSVANVCDGSVRPISISQTFTILPFVEQQVSFWVGNYRGNSGPVSIGVTIVDGTSNTLLLGEIATAPATDLDSAWQEFTYSYISQIPDGTSNTIVFSEIGGGGYYAGLDDISVAAVPEPSTWALALAGFVGLGMLGMRRRHLTPA